jgi:hypothetical protein
MNNTSKTAYPKLQRMSQSVSTVPRPELSLTSKASG